MTIHRRRILKGALAGAVVTTVLPKGVNAAAKPVRIGWTLSKSGPYAVGADLMTAPNYAMWLETVNAAGGIEVKGEGKRPVQYISLDDKSNPDVARDFYEKLCTVEKVDLLFAPWGTHMASEVAPIAQKHGYFLISQTVSSDVIAQQKLNSLFITLPNPRECMGAYAQLLAKLQKEGKIKKVGVAYNSDLAGIQYYQAFTALAKELKLNVVHTERYGLNAKELTGALSEFQKMGVDAFVGITYPEDTFAVTKAAIGLKYNPTVFMTNIGSSFPALRDAFKGAEGLIGLGFWNKKVKIPGVREYYDKFVKFVGHEPEYASCAPIWSILQITERCVKEVGLDRAKIKKMLETTEFQTIMGPIKFVNYINVATPGTIGQWQKGEFELVWPKERATSEVVVPKPAWAM